jgi:hypothetical protein
MRILGIGLLVLAGVLAAVFFAPRDRAAVFWDDDSPYCPFCRNEVNHFSIVCTSCYREYRWTTYENECNSCLAEKDAKALVRKFRESPDLFRQMLIGVAVDSGIPETEIQGALPDLVRWLETIDGGACLYCGGTGDWLAPNLAGGEMLEDRDDPLLAIAMKEMDGDCPVCLGGGRCIFCGGDHSLTCADEKVSLAQSARYRELEDADPGSGEEEARAVYRTLHEFITKYAGHEEMEDVDALYYVGPEHMDWGLNRLELIRSSLPDGE